MTRGRSALRLLLVIFAVAASFAHICVLPGHVHASPAVTDGHAPDEPAADHHDAPADSPYVESCEALRPGGSVPASPLLAAVTPVVTSAEVLVHSAARAVDARPPRASPPLYLVHRVLLI